MAEKNNIQDLKDTRRDLSIYAVSFNLAAAMCLLAGVYVYSVAHNSDRDIFSMPDRETTVKSAPEKANDVPDAPFGMKWSEIFIILGGGAAFAAHAIKGMNYLRRANKIKKQIEEYQNSNTK